MSQENELPLHIAIIMDGNRRWAKKRNIDVRVGHKKGAETLENIVRYCNNIGIKYTNFKLLSNVIFKVIILMIIFIIR